MRKRDREEHVAWSRRIAALVLSLVVAYAVSCGPATYCLVRDWMSPPVFDALYWPINMKSTRANGYTRWWGWLADRHDPDWYAAGHD